MGMSVCVGVIGLYKRGLPVYACILRLRPYAVDPREWIGLKFKLPKIRAKNIHRNPVWNTISLELEKKIFLEKSCLKLSMKLEKKMKEILFEIRTQQNIAPDGNVI